MQLDDIWMLNQFQNSHLSLDGEGHSADPVGVCACAWLAVIDSLQVHHTRSLRNMGSALGYNLDGDQLMGGVMARKANAGRSALAQGFAQLPWTNMGLLQAGAGRIGGDVRKLRYTARIRDFLLVVHLLK